MRKGKLVASFIDDGKKTEVEVASTDICVGDIYHLLGSLVAEVARASRISTNEVLLELSQGVLRREVEGVENEVIEKESTDV